ncbi:MAG: MFS transporter [Gammaproteobacteria bacterium]
MTPPRKALFEYGILAFALSFAGLPLYIHAPDFYSRDLGVDLALLGSVLLGLRLIDAFQDPFIGYVSDRYHQYRFGIILIGMTMLSVGMGVIFYGPQFNIPALVWFAIGMLLATTGFSIATINLNMLGAFWSDERNVRTIISGWRESFALIGLLVASVLPASLQFYYSPTNSFILMFWIFFTIAVFCFLFFSRFYFSYALDDKPINNKSVKFSLAPIFFGQDKRFFLICFISQVAASLPGVLVLFFIRDHLGEDHLSGLFLFLYFISGAVFMRFWIKCAEKFNKEMAWMISMCLSIITFIWAFNIEPGDVIAYALICCFSGIALGADLALPPSIMADRITVQKAQAEATQYYALLASIPKIAVAFSSGVSFLILDYVGFVPGGQNTTTAILLLLILYALVPCLLKLIAIVFLWRSQKVEGAYYENIRKNNSRGVFNVS